MKSMIAPFILRGMWFVSLAATTWAAESTPARISRAALLDKIRGAWAGQMIGVSYGALTEFRSRGRIIEADFIGIMCPGLPQAANLYCDRVGRVMNYGDGLYGGMFVAGMYATAYFEQDPRKIVAGGLACMPSESGYGKLIREVLDWSAQEPGDWRKVWQKIQDKWDKDDPCPEGAMTPFNIDAKLNGACIALGLLYGQGDWQRTMEIATRCGQDSDCNPSSAAGILGAQLWSNATSACR